MKIAFNPSNSSKNILDLIKNNKDIIFDLKGHSIYARGVEFKGTDTNTWRPVVDNLTSNSATSSLSANQGRVLAGLINGKSDSGHNHDGRYIRKSGDTMLGALNFANCTWNLVGDDSYMGDCNISGHFGIKAANTTYPGIAFFNNASAFLGNLTAYSGNIKYGAYSLQFLDNGNTRVSSSTWTNPFSAYNSNAVADGQAICVWGQNSYLSNLSTDTGDMSLWLKRVNAHAATLNMVLDGEYYANGNQRLAHISEIPTSLKNPHSLILKANGTTLAIYDGSSAKEANFTYANVGAASASHTHSYYAVNENYGGFKKAERLPTSGFYQSGESESGGNAPWKSWMHLINCQHSNTNNNYALQIAASFYDNNTFKIRVTNDSVNNAWRDIIHSGNISSQSVASATNAYHLRINSANTWSTWYWAGQSGQPSWLWGSNDGTNMYVWNPRNLNVNTAQYLRSLGNQNCQTGRTQAYGDVYTYNTYNNTGSPTAYTSVIGFGRGIGGTVEIAGGWGDTNLYWRSLRDCCDDWYSWRTVLDSDNYTDFINNYYWANVKISTSANTQTQPSVNTIYASNWFRSQGTSGWYSESYGGGIWMKDSSWIRTYGGKSFYCDNQIYSSNSIRMSNILLEHTDEINNNANGGINLNYRNSGNVSLCQGGGKVGIGTITPAYKLDVKGQVKASGFIHSDHSINDAVLLAGGGYERIFMLGTTRYYNNTSYALSFHKLSGLCNNLVWVDGCIWNSTSISFQLSSDFYPYLYANSPSMRTIYRMDGNNMITVDGNGIVIISCSSYPRRVGFFYTGRA